MKPPESLIGAAAVTEMCVLAGATPPGCFVEVGVYKGGSAWALAEVARAQDRELHLFDTFTGIPCWRDGDGHKVGDFADTSLAAVRDAIPGAVFHVGTFPATMPATLGPVAFVHCDCDQQDSVQAVIDEFWPRLVSGGVIAFNDMDQRAAAVLIRDEFDGQLQERMGVWFVRKS